MDTIFIEDNIGKIALICASVVFLIGFFLGWLVGHLRNNNYMQALMNKIEAGKAEIEKLKAGLKDSGEFFNHEIAVLTKEIDRRQCIINAYRIGQDWDSTQRNGTIDENTTISQRLRIAKANLEAQTRMQNVSSPLDPSCYKNSQPDEIPDDILQSPLL